MVGAVSVHVGEGLQVVVAGIPVGSVGFQNDGVLGSVAGDDVGTAVSDGVGALAVQVGLSGVVVLSTELTTLGLVVGAAHGSEHAVAQHGGEVRSGFSQGVLNGVIVESLNANLGEIGDFAGNILISVDNVSAASADQVFQAALGVHHVLHTGDEVVSLQVSNLTVLVVNPDNALTELEGVLQAVFRNGVAQSQSGLGLVLHVVLDQAVVGLNKDLGVSSVGSFQNVPVGDVSVKVESSGIFDGVALAGQVFLNPAFVLTGTDLLGPLGLHLSDVSSLDGLLGDDSVVETVSIVTEQNGGVGVRSDLSHSVVAALGSGGQENASAQQLSFGDSHLGITHRLAGLIHSILVVVVELTQNLGVNGAAQCVVILSILCKRIHIGNRSVGFVTLIGRSTGGQRGDHADSHQQSKQFFDVHIFPSNELYIPPFYKW